MARDCSGFRAARSLRFVRPRARRAVSSSIIRRFNACAPGHSDPGGVTALIKASMSTNPTRKTNPVIALFSSVRFGVTVLAMILAYASIMSAMPQVRGALEMTEMEAFRHWTFVSLIGLFAITLIITTWRRIRWNVTNLGVLTVHTGLIVFVAGAVWYFHHKVEGDVLLMSPRVEMISLRGAQSRIIGTALAEADKGWAAEMPAFGGAVGFVIQDVRFPTDAPAEATVRVRIGDGDVEEKVLRAGEPPSALANRLALRLRTFQPQTTFFDDEAPALAVRRASEDQPTVLPIHGLPYFRERFTDNGEPVTDSAGRPVASKRSWPHIPLLNIPTGWFEHWRMPIPLDAPDALPFDFEVTGYLPYISGFEGALVDGGDAPNPAAWIVVSQDGQMVSESLVALDPRASAGAQTPLEYRLVASEAEREALARPMRGPHELRVILKEPPIEKTVAVEVGDVIELPEAGYRLTVRELAPSWELISPGFEGAKTPMARVDVETPTLRFNRTAIERFPTLSQDIDDKGVRKREGLLDENLTLVYRSAPRGKLLLIGGPQVAPELVFLDHNGRVERHPAEVGKMRSFETAAAGRIDVMVRKLMDRAEIVASPVVEPLETRRPNMERLQSAIRVRIAGRGEHADWSDERWIGFTPYPGVNEPPFTPNTAIVRAPGTTIEYELIYTRTRRDLGVTLYPRKLETFFFPGNRNPTSWASTFVTEADGASQEAVVAINETATVGEWTLFQAGADSESHWRYTILGVGNRQGILPMLIGSILITLGSLYAFYVKPIIRRRKQEHALSQARARGALPSLERVAADELELSEAQS